MFSSNRFVIFRNIVCSENKFSIVNTVLRKMSNNELEEIFLKSVESVQPQNLIKNAVKLHENHLVVKGRTYQLNKPCFVVGFGKAVLGMATEIERVLGNKLQMGVVCVPEGIFEKHQDVRCSSKIQYVEGARNNLPDENALRGATMIQELALSLTAEDLLIVLISGGGSALLPLPIPPITLEEKQSVIVKLARKGANIHELNCVRKQISIMKGGGLAEMAHPCRVVSLVLSDIIGDPLDFIASGPTIPNSDSTESARSILKKYHLYDEIPHSVKIVLRKENRFSPSTAPTFNGEFEHVNTYIIGNNRIAAEAAKQEALNRGFQSAIVSTKIEGDVEEIARIYGELACNLASVISESSNKDNLKVFLGAFAEELRVERDFIAELLDMDYSRGICLIFAGEPTVVVTGNGKGGRNQQLALAFFVEVNKLGIKSADISFLSCGTDGIDGPTDAAGAISTFDSPENSSKINPESFLENNDAYSFYEMYNEGKNLIKIGHTGTNVMDIHILIVKPKKDRLE